VPKDQLQTRGSVFRKVLKDKTQEYNGKELKVNRLRAVLKELKIKRGTIRGSWFT